MGWWEEGPESPDNADDMQCALWGDTPADIIDNALYQINAAFVMEIGRPVSKAEILAGLRFSLGNLEDPAKMTVGMPNTPADAKPVHDTPRQMVTGAYYNAFADPRDGITLDQYMDANTRLREAMKAVMKRYKG